MTDAIARSNLIARLRQSNQWDVIVIGGGATGLGTAVEAATRGYQTLLVEQYDFAKGTSSRSTKLVHGGVRYLAQGNLSLVREALHERGLLRQNAPHLVQDRPFIVPGYARGASLYYGLGLKLYDWLSGRLSFGHSQWLTAPQTLKYIPTLKPDGLRGGVIYHDGQFDDARLAIALLRTLFDHQGIAINYLPVIQLLKQGEKVCGVQVCDAETGERFEQQSKAVINATGVFVDAIRQLDNPATPAMLSPSQGIHLVVDRAFLPGQHALMIPKTEDGRVLFAIPWHNHTVIGTTDTPVDQVALEPRPLPDEIDFILRTAAQYLTPAPTQNDVLSVFVGQRPLVRGNTASTAQLSREHTIELSQSGLLTVTGGKWTTYRKMAEDVMEQAIAHFPLTPHPSITTTLPLHGWTQTPEPEPFTVYGSDTAQLLTLAGSTTPLHPRLPYVEAEVRWAARYELARTVEDVLARRTRSLFLDAIASLEAAPRVAAILAEELSRDVLWQQQQCEHYQTLAQGYQLGLISNPVKAPE